MYTRIILAKFFRTINVRTECVSVRFIPVVVDGGREI